jgi:hypothetical protein
MNTNAKSEQVVNNFREFLHWEIFPYISIEKQDKVLKFISDLAASLSAPAPQTEGEDLPMDAAETAVKLNYGVSDERREAAAPVSQPAPAEGEAAPQDWKDETLLKTLWHSRNPSHERNTDDGKDMFWATVLCVFEDYSRLKSPLQSQLQAAQAEIDELRRIVEARRFYIQNQEKAYCNQYDQLKEAQAENERLKAWKDEAIEVMPDFHEIGKLIGAKLGSSVSKQIIPFIKEQAAQLQQAEARIKELRETLEALANQPEERMTWTDQPYRMREIARQAIKTLQQQLKEK